MTKNVLTGLFDRATAADVISLQEREELVQRSWILRELS